MATVAKRTARRQAGMAAELAAAFQHHQAGRFERAAALYRKILDKTPDNPDALHLLGVLALGEGRAELGKECRRHALQKQIATPLARITGRWAIALTCGVKNWADNPRCAAGSEPCVGDSQVATPFAGRFCYAKFMPEAVAGVESI